MLNIILLGPPGSGKGTQADALIEVFNLYKLSTGDLIRSEIASGSQVGLQVKKIVESGGFSNDEIVIDLVEKKLDEIIATGKGIIFDGFPRTVNQASRINEILSKKNIRLTHVIKINIDDQSIVDRLEGRFSCARCGATYNTKSQKLKKEGICDACGFTEFKKRADDEEQIIRERLKLYKEMTDPLTDFYREKGFLYEIDGTQKVDQVSHQIVELLRRDGLKLSIKR